MRVLIDTSILVSAVLRDKDPEAIILWVIGQSDWEWVTSDDILREYNDVLRRPKFKLPEAVQALWLDRLAVYTVAVVVGDTMDFPRDQKDAKFLACARASNANYFITGDRDFSEAQKLVSTTILSVSRFKEMFWSK